MKIFMASNLESFRKNMRTRQKNLENAGIKSHRDAARLMSLRAKELAPKKSGALIMNISARYGKNNSMVRSSVLKSFPYNLWVNVSPGFEKVTLRGKLRTYASTRHTGTPGYFDIAVMEIAKKFPEIVRKNVRYALGSKGVDIFTGLA
jgi:hypothetical protein